MAKRKERPRTTRRKIARTRERIAHLTRKLAALSPGGSPEHPQLLASPAQVEVEATSAPCPFCDGPMRVEEHTAETHPVGGRLRVAKIACAHCGEKLRRYYRIHTPS